jgi:hypothetical protein
MDLKKNIYGAKRRIRQETEYTCIYVAHGQQMVKQVQNIALKHGNTSLVNKTNGN